MMQPPKHVLLELDEDGDLHSVDGDSDAPAVVGATEGDSPPAPARPGIVGAVLVADLTAPEERRTAATPVSMLTPTLPAEAPTRRAGLRARPKQRDLSWGPGDGSQPKKPRTAAQLACDERRRQAAALRKPRGPGTVIVMRRVGDASWRRFGTQKDAAKAFGLYQSEVSYLVNDRSKASASARLFEARRVAAAAPVCDRPSRRIKCVEGATQKQNGIWTNHEMFPGREFDDLDAYRAAKKQRKEQRREYIAQTRHNMYS